MEPNVILLILVGEVGINEMIVEIIMQLHLLLVQLKRHT